jgi:hypothetical protein
MKQFSRYALVPVERMDQTIQQRTAYTRFQENGGIADQAAAAHCDKQVTVRVKTGMPQMLCQTLLRSKTSGSIVPFSRNLQSDIFVKVTRAIVPNYEIGFLHRTVKFYVIKISSK